MIVGPTGLVWAIMHPPRMVRERRYGSRYSEDDVEVIDVHRGRVHAYGGSWFAETTYDTADVTFVCPD